MNTQHIFFYDKTSEWMIPFIEEIVGPSVILCGEDCHRPRIISSTEPSLVLGDLLYRRDDLCMYLTEQLINIRETEPWRYDTSLSSQWKAAMKRIGYLKSLENKLSNNDNECRFSTGPSVPSWILECSPEKTFRFSRVLKFLKSVDVLNLSEGTIGEVSDDFFNSKEC